MWKGVNMVKVLEELLKQGISKYAIAKKCFVSWNTVNLWSKGVYTPTTKHEDILALFFSELNQQKK